jgi:hypothetical protein
VPVTQADETHVTGLSHPPEALQVWIPLLEHSFAPGVHTPMQVPLAQAWFEQGVLSCHVPLASQVCGVKPLH